VRPPLWALLLEAADGDPLRAMEIEENVSAEWWYRWLTWYSEKANAQPKSNDD